MSGVWLESQLVLPFIAWELDGSTFHYEFGGWFWYNIQTVLIHDRLRGFSRRCYVDTERGRNYCNELTWDDRVRPYLHAYVLSATYENDVGMYFLMTDYTSHASAATLQPAIPAGSRVRITMVVQNDPMGRWGSLPRLHIQFDPPIPPLERAAHWDVMLPRCGLRWEVPEVYHWVPGHVRPTGDEIVVLPTATETTFAHEFRTDVEIGALGIAFEFGDGLNVDLEGRPTTGIPIPWTDVSVLRIEYLPPREQPVERVREFDRDWQARLARTRQVVGG